MNERIKELEDQATTFEEIWGRGFDTTQYTEHFSKEKFAELIVKKCMELTKRCSTGKGIHDLFADEIIKEHFGVEE